MPSQGTAAAAQASAEGHMMRLRTLSRIRGSQIVSGT